MNEVDIRIMNVADARRSLTSGDKLSDIAFQRDVNRLLARLDDIFEPELRAPPVARELVSPDRVVEYRLHARR